MNILIIILAIIGVLVSMVLLVAAFMSSTFTIDTNIVINKPVAQVYNYIKYLKNAELYNKWVMIDPAMRKQYRGVDGTVGFVYAWDSDNKQAGKGEQEIIKMEENKSVNYEIRFEKPFQNIMHSHFELAPDDANQTHITFGMVGQRTFGMRVFHVLLNLKKILQKDMYITLQNLKNNLER